MRRRLRLVLPCEINVSTPVATAQTDPVRLRRRRRMRVDTRADECGRPKTDGHGAEVVRHELAVAAAVAVDVRGTRAGRLPLLAVAPAVPISPGLPSERAVPIEMRDRSKSGLRSVRESTDAMIELNGWPHMSRVEEIFLFNVLLIFV